MRRVKGSKKGKMMQYGSAKLHIAGFKSFLHISRSLKQPGTTGF